MGRNLSLIPIILFSKMPISSEEMKLNLLIEKKTIVVPSILYLISERAEAEGVGRQTII